jgi:hypothetical protein
MIIYVNTTGPDSYGVYFAYRTNLIQNIDEIITANHYVVLCNRKVYEK